MGDTATFDCSPIGFRGESLAQVGMDDYLLQFYENPEGAENATYQSFVNPFSFGLAINVDSIDECPDGPYMANDPNIVVPYHGAWIIIWCNVSVFDIFYARVNGTITVLSPNLSNGTSGGMVLATLLNAFEIDRWKESFA